MERSGTKGGKRKYAWEHQRHTPIYWRVRGAGRHCLANRPRPPEPEGSERAQVSQRCRAYGTEAKDVWRALSLLVGRFGRAFRKMAPCEGCWSR